MKKYALIVAGGIGARMGSQQPKQFLLLQNEPILFHTIKAFHKFSDQIRIVLVLPQQNLAWWKQLCKTSNFKVNHDVVAGGQTRTESVTNGLELLSGEGVVAIHDGVRPLVSTMLIKKCFDSAL